MEGEVKMLQALINWPTIITLGWVYILGVASCSPSSRAETYHPSTVCTNNCN